MHFHMFIIVIVIVIWFPILIVMIKIIIIVVLIIVWVSTLVIVEAALVIRACGEIVIAVPTTAAATLAIIEIVIWKICYQSLLFFFRKCVKNDKNVL